LSFSHTVSRGTGSSYSPLIVIAMTARSRGRASAAPAAFA
jgi:hypothetical protein